MVRHMVFMVSLLIVTIINPYFSPEITRIIDPTGMSRRSITRTGFPASAIPCNHNLSQKIPGFGQKALIYSALMINILPLNRQC